MSNPNINLSNLDSRYIKTADVAAAISAQATADAGHYLPLAAGGLIRLAAWGDSLTANYNGTNYEPTTHIADAGFLQITSIKSNGLIDYAGNFGVPGQTSDQILARLADVLAAKPTHCTVLAGANDSTHSTTVTNVTLMVQQLLAAGVIPVICTRPPNRTLSDSALQTKIRQDNAFFRELAGTYGLRLVDFYSTLVNAPDGDYLAGYYSDAIHPNIGGYALMAQALTNALQPSFGGSYYRRMDNTLLGSELLTNGLFLNWSSGLPTGWSIATMNTGNTIQQTTDSDFAGGSCFELIRTAGTTGDAAINQQINATAGHLIEYSYRVKLTGMTASDPGAPYIRSYLGYPGSDIDRVNLRNNLTGRIRRRFIMPNPTGPVRAEIWFQNTQTAQVSLRVGEFSVRDLTALGHTGW